MKNDGAEILKILLKIISEATMGKHIPSTEVASLQTHFHLAITDIWKIIKHKSITSYIFVPVYLIGWI